MTLDFERSKELVCGRSVLITSWYDDEIGTWRAGAPTYSFVGATLLRDGTMYQSRKTAIERTVALLINRFKTDDATVNVLSDVEARHGRKYL